MICLANCLDFLEQKNLKKLKDHYASIKKDSEKNKWVLLTNSGGKDLYKRELDCLVINSLVSRQRENNPEEAYGSVRGVFFEGNELNLFGNLRF